MNREKNEHVRFMGKVNARKKEYTTHCMVAPTHESWILMLYNMWIDRTFVQHTAAAAVLCSRLLIIPRAYEFGALFFFPIFSARIYLFSFITHICK